MQAHNGLTIEFEDWRHSQSANRVTVTNSCWRMHLVRRISIIREVLAPCSNVVGRDYKTVRIGTAVYSRHFTSRSWTAAVWRTASSGYPLPWVTLVLGEGNRTVVTGTAIYTINICCLVHRVRRISSIREEAVSWWVGTIEPLGFWIQPQQHCTGWPRKHWIGLPWSTWPRLVAFTDSCRWWFRHDHRVCLLACCMYNV
jgi:hypothetical protein